MQLPAGSTATRVFSTLATKPCGHWMTPPTKAIFAVRKTHMCELQRPQTTPKAPLGQDKLLLRHSATDRASGWPCARLAQAKTEAAGPAGLHRPDADHASRAAHRNDGYLVVTCSHVEDCER